MCGGVLGGEKRGCQRVPFTLPTSPALPAEENPAWLPLYGSVCCRLVAQPLCMTQPTASGALRVQVRGPGEREGSGRRQRGARPPRNQRAVEEGGRRGVVRWKEGKIGGWAERSHFSVGGWEEGCWGCDSPRKPWVIYAASWGAAGLGASSRNPERHKPLLLPAT